MGPSAALLVHHPPGTRNGPDGAAPTGSTARAEVIAAASHRTARRMRSGYLVRSHRRAKTP